MADTDAFLIAAHDASMVQVCVDGKAALLWLDQPAADSLKREIERLKSEPQSSRLDFYRDLLGDGPLAGRDSLRT
jgi:hypothetical protein